MEDEFPDSFIESVPVAQMPSRDTIRDSVKEKVDNVLWLDSLIQEDEAYHKRLMQGKSTSEKCMVCTLPYGSCIHTMDWIDKTNENRNRAKYDDPSLDQSIEDMLNVMGEFKVDTAPVMDDIDINEMLWKPLEENLTDKIGNKAVCLFAPDERGWHSTVKLGANLVFVFGGFQYR